MYYQIFQWSNLPTSATSPPFRQPAVFPQAWNALAPSIGRPHTHFVVSIRSSLVVLFTPEQKLEINIKHTILNFS